MLSHRFFRLVLFAALSATSACATVKYDGAYDSKLSVPAMPLTTSVTVLVDPALQKDWNEKDTRLEQLRETMSDALTKDLAKNGPLSPVTSNPDARLDIVITRAKNKDLKLYMMMWFFAPVWLFGVPYHNVSLELEADARLTAARGGVVFETKLAAKCSQVEGLYYGHDDLMFGCAVKEIGEKLRQKISLRRSAILAGVERTRPPPAPVVVTPPPAPVVVAKVMKPAAPSVAAVFMIRDMSGSFEPLILDQLTEYLAVQMTQRLGYQVVPRALLKAQIVEAKKESFNACYDDACQIELGKAMAATKSVSTTLIKIGNKCAVNTTVYDLKTEAAERAAGVETDCGEEGLLDGVTRVVQEMMRPVSPS